MGAAGVAVHQDLANVRSSRAVISAKWKREPDSYTLYLVLDRSRYSQTARLPALPPQDFTPRPEKLGEIRDPAERSKEFIANTIANLRSLDPSFTCEWTPSLVNATPSSPTPPANAPGGPNRREPRVDVWLLKADGTDIQPVKYSCQDPGRFSGERSDVSIAYEYSVAEGALAVAAAIRVEDRFHLEMLRPLAAASPPR